MAQSFSLSTGWALPAHGPAIVATALGLMLLAAAIASKGQVARLLLRPKRTHYLAGLSLIAAALSWFYVEHYLRGGPRIIDATSYYLQARTFADGQLAFEPPGPIHSFLGRFLLPTPEGRLAVIFPPGYPALLALGFLLGVPLLVGPALAAALVWATYWLCTRIFEDELAARGAALLSVLCGTLRYHTADTMSHGLCALLVTLCLGCAIGQGRARHWVGGLLLGWLCATRPVSGLACGLAIGWVLLRTVKISQERWHFLGWGSALVGVGALVIQQHAITGHWFRSSQYQYYALTDGPPGCFAWGLSSSGGCLVEHGAFVSRYLPGGYGPIEALGTTLRRLQMHLSDPMNFEALSLLLPVALWLFRRQIGAQLLGVGLALHVLFYAGFYFDGNYPGGGARMFADVLPLEHVLLAALVVRWQWLSHAVSLMLLSFGTHQSAAHRLLADREGGAPMFQQEPLNSAERALLTQSPSDDRASPKTLVLINTDHGFNLGFDPSPMRRRVVARQRGDASDYALWQALDTPPALRYDYTPFAKAGSTSITTYKPAITSRYEAEDLLPPLQLTNGWVLPTLASGPCISQGKYIEARSSGVLTLTAQLWVPQGGQVRWRLAFAGPQHSAARPRPPSLLINQQIIQLKPERGHCASWVSPQLELGAGPVTLQLQLGSGTRLDFIEIETTAPN